MLFVGRGWHGERWEDMPRERIQGGGGTPLYLVSMFMAALVRGLIILRNI